MDETIPRQLRQLWITRFDFLAGCLPGRAAPTDIDQVIERRGHFLFIECKRPHQEIGTGQAITFDNLVALSTEAATVRLLIVIGHPPDQIEAFGWWRKPSKPGTVGDVRNLVRRWYDWAS